MIASRRSLLGGLLATLAAPAIIRTPGLLMPVRVVRPPRLLTEADVEWATMHNHYWFEICVGGVWTDATGKQFRHGVRMDEADAGGIGFHFAKQHVLAALNAASGRTA